MQPKMQLKTDQLNGTLGSFQESSWLWSIDLDVPREINILNIQPAIIKEINGRCSLAREWRSERQMLNCLSCTPAETSLNQQESVSDFTFLKKL